MKISLSLMFALCLIFTVVFAAPIAKKEDDDDFEMQGGGGRNLDCHTPEGQSKFRCR
ncbi:8252_t:CDS:2 [Funneliformis geosporum]|uniref:19311_t:CDS:1 n=1 Tax=Funneliformis geosporum TaxID=1117311 RepID=A0A9W4SF91_9GLOM|nr:19311_t:CDS:2 [Funneliformis geosporum]CAI2178029.1 8252_t:CDS:2 [Funneliformis geosporum]